MLLVKTPKPNKITHYELIIRVGPDKWRADIEVVNEVLRGDFDDNAVKRILLGQIFDELKNNVEEIEVVDSPL